VAKPAPETTVRRLLLYFDYLKNLERENISSPQIAEHFNFTAIQVRKDIFCTGFTGRPKHGYNRKELMAHIDNFLGISNQTDAFLIGAGNLGRALSSYGGFAKYALNIVAIGDINAKLHGKKINDKPVFSVQDSLDLIKKKGIRLAIIAVPAQASQEVADMLVKAGIRAIWNFSSVRLNCGAEVIVQNEDLGASLSVLSQKLLVAQQAGGQ
jgi:redox-sensing transcriptional repressor